MTNLTNRTAIHTFILGILLSSVVLLPFILDLTLVPRYISLTVCMSIALYHMYQFTDSLRVRVDNILGFYAAYTAFCVLSVFWSTASSEAVFESAKQVAGFFVFLLVYFSLKLEAGYFFNKILRVSVIIFAFLFLIVLFQIHALPHYSKEGLYTISGLNGHKNLLASFLFLNLLFLILAVLKLTKPWKITAGICAGLNVSLLLFLQTKAVWMGLLVALTLGLILFLLLKSKRWNAGRIPIIISLLGFIFICNVFFLKYLQPFIQKSIQYTTQINSDVKPGDLSLKSEEERLVLWDKTYPLIEQNKYLGVGMGNWQVHFPNSTLTGLWRAEDLNYTFQRPHNDFLWILAETGWIGFNLFLLFIVSLFILSIRCLSVLKSKNLSTLDLLLYTAFMAGYLCISFFDFPKERIEHTVWINCVFACIYFHIKSERLLSDHMILKPGKSSLFLGFVFITCLAFFGLLRLNGEYFMRRVLNYKNANRPRDLISAGNSALSFAYSIDPTSVPVYWYMGNAEAVSGNYKEAQDFFIKAQQLAPYNRNVLNDLASSYVYSNDVIKAKQYYEEAARISPRFDEPKLNLAAIYINAGDYLSADFWLKSLLHDSERRSNYQRMVDAYLKR